MMRTLRIGVLVGGRVCPLAKRNPIVERIGHGQLRHAPFLRLQAGAVVAIFLVVQLAMQGLNAGHIDINDRARRAVSVVLAQIDGKSCSGNLHEHRRIRLEAVLSFDLEAEKVEVEFARLLQRENPENRDGALKLDRHRGPP